MTLRTAYYTITKTRVRPAPVVTEQKGFALRRFIVEAYVVERGEQSGQWFAFANRDGAIPHHDRADAGAFERSMRARWGLDKQRACA